MISFNDYKSSFQAFHNIDADSWIDFEEKELTLHSLRKRVLVPHLYSKPTPFMRLLYWIFDCLRGEAQNSRTAKKLITCLKISISAIKDSNIETQLQALEVTETLLKKLTRDPDTQVRQMREIQEIRAGLIADQQLVYVLKKCSLGPRNREVAYAMNWSKDDPLLFDPTYMTDLITRQKKHPDMHNPLIPTRTKTQFITFISNLWTGKTILDHYGTVLSKDNTDRIRQMMLAIMNLVNAARREPQFQEFYASIINIICLAMDNCSNRINTEIEGIFYDLNYPKEGNLGQRIRPALQEFRAQVFRKGIHLHVAQNAYYLEHEAASANYYGKMAERFGLPPSVSRMDRQFEKFAMKGLEESIARYFESEYTPSAIFQKLSEAIQDPNDTSIPCQLFVKWLEANYSIEERYNLLDDTGKYSPECFIRLFTELQIFE